MIDIQGKGALVGRPARLEEVRRSLDRNPVVALLGPRQCGKTTLARLIAGERKSEIFDLENPVDLRRLEAPMLALEHASGL